jgi:glycosyltransferase involved in cell wall biosynthesis
LSLRGAIESWEGEGGALRQSDEAALTRGTGGEGARGWAFSSRLQGHSGDRAGGGAGPLRVAMLAPISWRVPPRHYGPWEQFVSLLTEGLVDRGVDVTLFATADSVTSARLSGTAPTGYSEDPALDPKVWEGLHISAVFERAQEFDLIHNSFDFLPLTYSGLVETPVVTTIHGFSSERIVPVYEKYNAHGYYVAISDADRHENLVYVATIHHGIDMQEFDVGAGDGDYLLFFGRIHPEKGTAEAIEVAAQADLPLTIAGIVQDREYFERVVEPRIDGKSIRYLGPVERERRVDLLGGARALVHLVNFDEPFGFSVVEAMACGTPVIATRRGSMSEIVRDGVNGYLVDSVDEAVAAVDAVSRLARSGVRASVENRFDSNRMVDDYLAVYRRVVELHRATGAREARSTPMASAFGLLMHRISTERG